MHIFALAHLIQRPVIVLPLSAPIDCAKRPANLLSLATSRSSAYHFLEGFYVPFFSENETVTRSPLCLLHENGLFFNWVTNDGEFTGLMTPPSSQTAAAPPRTL